MCIEVQDNLPKRIISSNDNVEVIVHDAGLIIIARRDNSEIDKIISINAYEWFEVCEQSANTVSTKLEDMVHIDCMLSYRDQGILSIVIRAYEFDGTIYDALTYLGFKKIYTTNGVI